MVDSSQDGGKRRSRLRRLWMWRSPHFKIVGGGGSPDASEARGAPAQRAEEMTDWSTRLRQGPHPHRQPTVAATRRASPPTAFATRDENHLCSRLRGRGDGEGAPWRCWVTSCSFGVFWGTSSSVAAHLPDDSRASERRTCLLPQAGFRGNGLALREAAAVERVVARKSAD